MEAVGALTCQGNIFVSSCILLSPRRCKWGDVTVTEVVAAFLCWGCVLLMLFILTCTCCSTEPGATFHASCWVRRPVVIRVAVWWAARGSNRKPLSSLCCVVFTSFCLLFVFASSCDCLWRGTSCCDFLKQVKSSLDEKKCFWSWDTQTYTHTRECKVRINRHAHTHEYTNTHLLSLTHTTTYS